MRTPAVSPKIIAAIPVLISIGAASALIYFYGLNPYFSPFTLGIIAGGLVDLDNGLTGKLKNILFTLLAFAVASLSVQAAFGQPVLLTATFTLLAFCFTLIGVAGLRFRTIAFGTLVVAAYTSMTHEAGAAWYLNPLLIMAGTLLYSGCAVLVHLIFPHRPVQANMAAAYDALADYLHAKAGFFDPDEADFLEQQEITLAMGNTKVTDAFNQCRASLFYRMRGQHRHPRTTRMLRYYFTAQDIHERISSSHVHYRAFAEQMKNTDLIFRIQKMLLLQERACRDFAAVLRGGKEGYQYSPKLERATQGAEQALNHYAEHAQGDAVAPYRVQRLLDNITHVSLQFSHLGNPDTEDLGEGDRIRLSAPEAGGFKGAFRALRGQTTPQSPVFRHAVRMAVIVWVCCLLIQFAPDINRHLLSENMDNPVEIGFWMLLTGIFVCQPNYSATKKRLVQRILGTVAGVLVGSFLPVFALTLETKLLIVTVTTTLFFFFRTNKHSFSTFFITIQAIIGFSIMGHDVTEFFLPRVADTVIGAVIAGLAVYFIWPDWKYLALEKTGAQAVKGNAIYLKAILNELQQYGIRDDVSYRHARRISHDRAAALSSTLSDMSGDPKKYGSRLQDGFLLLKINYSLISYISALGAYRNKMHLGNDEETAFLARFFPIAEQTAELMEQMNEWDEDTFQAALNRLQNDLESLRADYSRHEQDDMQNQVLWQQLVMISGLLLPCYRALHTVRAQADAEPAAQAA